MPTPSPRPTAARRLHLALVALLALTALAAAVALPAAPAHAATAVTTSDLNLRVGYRVTSKAKLVMPEGAVVELINRRVSPNGYWKVSYQGTRGYAHTDYLDFSGDGGGGGNDGGGATGTATTTSSLNLRSRASANSAVLLVMPPGASVTLTGQSSNGFLGVTYRGTSGWASAQYLDTSGGGGGDGGGGGGASTIGFPVSGGGWTVIQGYNGGTHQGVYQNALDLARVGGGTSGATVISPVTGTVVWSDPGSGGILIDMGNGYGIAMFHVTFDGSLGRGSAVTKGQAIGFISAPGGNGYAATPHVEIDVWDISNGRVSAPFTGANALAGNELPNDGSRNQYGGTVFYP